MKIKKFINNNYKVIKDILSLILFFVILAILLFFYKFIIYKHSLEKNLELEKLEYIIQLKDQEIFNLKNRMFFSELDLLNDDSLTKFVDNEIPFFDLGYIPDNLVPVSSDYIVDSKGGSIKVRSDIKEALDSLAKHFYEDNKTKLVIVSGYRSYNYQKGIKDRGCPDNLCAKPGYSEHQSGLAIDIYSASTEQYWLSNKTLTKYFEWFKTNAHNYGFHQSYQNGVAIDGYEIEPWHWRYVGIPLAKYLLENDITFGEFYDKIKKERQEKNTY